MKMMAFTKIFNQLSKHDVALAGGKGASLGEMTQAGIPVPPGFVVTAQAFDEFLKATDLNVELDAILDQVDHTQVHQVNEASEKTNAVILKAIMPGDIVKAIAEAHNNLDAEFVAVRSSATSEDSADAAWAGQLESYLNITQDNLLEHVQKCWASLFTPRAIFYRFEKGLHGNSISVAVVVQAMIQSEVSGIAFSVHPVTQDHDQLIIEAGFGLGEAIVQGAITPDSYVIEKSASQILDKNITIQEKGIFKKDGGGDEWQDIPQSKGEQPTLSDDEVIELSQLVTRIEQHYDFPVDVEWAKENDEFFIVQSRPITTLSEEPTKGNADSEWHYLGRWLDPLLSAGLWIEWKGLAQQLDLNLKGDITIVDGYQYVRQSDVDATVAHFKTKFTDDADWFNRLFRQCEKNTDAILSNKTNDDLDGALKAATNALGFVTILMLLDIAFQDFVRDIVVKENVSVEDFFSMIKPHKATLLMEYHNELRTLAEGSDEQKSQFLEKYAWVGSHTFSGEGLTAEKLEDEIANAKQAAQTNDKLNTAQLTPTLHSLWELGNKLAYYRSYIVECTVSVLYSKYDSAKKRGRDNGLTWDEVLLLDYEELINLGGGQKPPKDFRNRKEGFGILLRDGTKRIIDGDELKRELNEYLDVVDVDVREVTGMVACRGGIVKGTVRIVEDSAFISKVGEGDILVANETTPDYVVGMRVAGAIITNQGGITSHAAITSREMGIPCIIGTQVATQVFKDGDDVEVDTDSGAVRKIT